MKSFDNTLSFQELDAYIKTTFHNYTLLTYSISLIHHITTITEVKDTLVFSQSD